ncbi:hypothetical protein [Labrys miyagiensis]|uniref:hypothetical protein n=1 Tax=Labrys miyagiensis TaxID=346912 RepID=UPI0024E0B3C3|nr:hypothetical protein [Labrys miyagiensis]
MNIDDTRLKAISQIHGSIEELPIRLKFMEKMPANLWIGTDVGWFWAYVATLLAACVTLHSYRLDTVKRQSNGALGTAPRVKATCFHSTSKPVRFRHSCAKIRLSKN